MQKEKVVKACKSTIGTILIAIFIVIGVFLAIKICWGTEIENIFMLANKVSININKDKEQQPITIDEEKNHLIVIQNMEPNMQQLKFQE